MGRVKRLRIVVFRYMTPCMFVHEYRTTRHHITEDRNVHSHYHEGPLKLPLIKLRGQIAVFLSLRATGAPNIYSTR